MKIYLDDDSCEALLVRLLQADGHDVLVSDQAGNRGIEDPAHFLYAIKAARVLFTHNHEDFELLHELVVGAGGRHPGLLVVRRDNNPKRDLDAKKTVYALRKLLHAGAPVADSVNVLNHWR